jgi:hypothetical protein
VLAGEVVAPVLFEVAVADDGAEGEDGFGSVQASSRAADVEAVGDEVPAGALDDAGRDGLALREGLVVAQVLVPGVQVAGSSSFGPDGVAASELRKKNPLPSGFRRFP